MFIFRVPQENAIVCLIFVMCAVYIFYKCIREKNVGKTIHYTKLPYNEKCEFSNEKLKLEKELGSGEFGTVWKAIAYGIRSDEDNTTVAVKMPKRKAKDEVRSI